METISYRDEIKIFYDTNFDELGALDLAYLWLMKVIKVHKIDEDIILHFLESKKWNFKSFLYKLSNLKLCTYKFLTSEEDNLNIDFCKGYKELKSFIINSENYNEEHANEILFYFMVNVIFVQGYQLLYELENYLNNFTYNKDLYNFNFRDSYIPAFIKNFVLCEESPEEDNDFHISDGICINSEKYDKIIECLDSILDINDDELTRLMINKIKKEIL